MSKVLNALRRVRRGYAALIGLAEWAFHAALLAACWWVVLQAVERGSAAWRQAVLPPLTVDTALVFVLTPGLGDRLLQLGLPWGTLLAAAVIGLPIALSATQGTWWVLRRLGRPF